jgi:tryptophan synthase alpha chain
MTGRIAAAFDKGRPAFIPYITAGDPDLGTTRALVHAIAAAGADVIELGVPFSDPIADGPTNQRAAERALATGTTPAAILGLVSELRAEGVSIPIVLFSYLNPLLSLGPDLGAALAASGVDGALVVDLPAEEAGDHEASLASAGVDRIYLAAPSTDPQRLRCMGERGSGFLYYVSRYGVTGEQSEVPLDLAQAVDAARRLTGRKVAVGFGIGTAAQAREVAGVADRQADRTPRARSDRAGSRVRSRTRRSGARRKEDIRR